MPAASYEKSAFTSTELEEILGKYDQIAIQVVVQQIDKSGGTFNLLIEHSSDGEHWSQKNHSAVIPPVGEVNIPQLVDGSNIGWGSDPNALANPPEPSLARVRFRMYFTGKTGGGKIKVFVTQRDQAD